MCSLCPRTAVGPECRDCGSDICAGCAAAGRCPICLANVQCPQGTTKLPLSDEFALQKQAQWRAYVRKSLLDEAPVDLGTVVQRVADFLVPVLAEVGAGTEFRCSWSPAQGWTP